MTTGKLEPKGVEAFANYDEHGNMLFMSGVAIKSGAVACGLNVHIIPEPTPEQSWELYTSLLDADQKHVDVIEAVHAAHIKWLNGE